jgi:cysteinyl-tRNA synthetase
MSMKYLGESFDIHCGGGDHIPVHHTNEIAQSEGATGKPWVAYWLHGEFLVMPGRRMGKSEGNSVILKDVLDRGYDPMDYRYYLLGAHYRSQLAFTWQALDAAARGRKSLLSLLTRLARSASTAGDPGTLTERARARRDEIVSGMTEDLNAPKALGKLRDVLSDDDLSPNERVAVVLDVDAIFGLRLSESVNHQSDQQQKTARSEAPDSQTQALVERQDARAWSADCPSRRVAKTGEHTEFSYGFPCGPWYNRPNAYNQLKGVRR